MEEDTPVSEMPMSESKVNDQSCETDKTEFASQQQQEQPSVITNTTAPAVSTLLRRSSRIKKAPERVDL